MSALKFSTDLLLENLELNRFQSFLSDETKYSNIQNTDNFGFFKNLELDPKFDNGRVYSDGTNDNGDICVKVMPLSAIDGDGNFLFKGEQTNKIAIPNDGYWYWIKLSYQQTIKEVGTYSIDIQGNFVCTSGNGYFKTKLRGLPNFPTKIRFLNSSVNSSEYDVLSVVDDNHAVLSSPSFVAENNLTYGIYGTYTPDHAPLAENQFPFRFDDAKISVVAETNGVNVKPTYSLNYEFFSARVKINNGILTIQDKRNEFIYTIKNFDQNKFLSNNYSDPAQTIAIESIKWKRKDNTNEANQVKLTWGFLVDTWNVDINNNQLILLSGRGGSYKNTSGVPVGYFDNWRVYTNNGNYHTILNSNKTGSVITLQLDSVLVDNFFENGLVDKIIQTLVIVPPANYIEFKFIPDLTEFNQSEVIFESDIKKGEKTILIPVYDKISYYRFYFRLISDDLITEWTLPTTNEIGYLAESSFTDDGKLKDTALQVFNPYSPNDSLGFIRLNAHPDYYAEFKRKTNLNLNQSDTVGFKDNQNYVRLHGGISPMRQIVRGNTLSTSFSDLYISLESDTAEEGTQFFIYLMDDLTLSTTKLNIVKDFVINETPTIIKTIDKSDLGIAINSEKGICIQLIYTNYSWVVIEEYTKLPENEVIMWHGTLDRMNELFDTNGGVAKPYKGYLVCNGVNGTPQMMGNFPVGYNSVDNNFSTLGKAGGNSEVTIRTENMPVHQHTSLFYHTEYVKDNTGSGASKVVLAYGGSDNTGTPPVSDGTGQTQDGETAPIKTGFTGGTNTSKPGEAVPLTVLPPYVPLLFIKRNF